MIVESSIRGIRLNQKRSTGRIATIHLVRKPSILVSTVSLVGGDPCSMIVECLYGTTREWSRFQTNCLACVVFLNGRRDQFWVIRSVRVRFLNLWLRVFNTAKTRLKIEVCRYRPSVDPITKVGCLARHCLSRGGIFFFYVPTSMLRFGPMRSVEVHSAAMKMRRVLSPVVL